MPLIAASALRESLTVQQAMAVPLPGQVDVDVHLMEQYRQGLEKVFHPLLLPLCGYRSQKLYNRLRQFPCRKRTMVCNCVIVHVERRKAGHEDDEDVAETKFQLIIFDECEA